MEKPNHSIVSLFNQLGLDSSKEGINTFVVQNGMLPGNIALHQAVFWNMSQASFLQEAVDEDADWVDIVNQLDAMLR